MSFWDKFDSDSLVAAHRGYRAVQPENTLAAFEASIGRCDFVELDVGFSKDGIPIIIHDDTLKRTSNAESLHQFYPPYNVIDYSYEELKKLDVSSWFLISDPFKTLINSVDIASKLKEAPIQRIPTLYEALSLLKSYKMPVNIELKDMSATVYDTDAVSRTVEVIRDLDMEDMTLLSSFNHSYISEAKVYAPKISRAIIQEKKHHKDLVGYLDRLGVECYHSDIEIISEKIIRELVEAGVIVNVFTVNEPKVQKRLFGWGVRTVFSDYCRDSKPS